MRRIKTPGPQKAWIMHDFPLPLISIVAGLQKRCIQKAVYSSLGSSSNSPSCQGMPPIMSEALEKAQGREDQQRVQLSPRWLAALYGKPPTCAA